jgi:hypothetical protein
MGRAIEDGSASKRARRRDAFNFKVVYDWIHHTNISGFSLPDFCAYVELDKSQRGEWVGKRCSKLYRELRDEYEHLTSEESFIESCECNEITFEENEDEVCN